MAWATCLLCVWNILPYFCDGCTMACRMNMEYFIGTNMQAKSEWNVENLMKNVSPHTFWAHTHIYTQWKWFGTSLGNCSCFFTVLVFLWLNYSLLVVHNRKKSEKHHDHPGPLNDIALQSHINQCYGSTHRVQHRQNVCESVRKRDRAKENRMRNFEKDFIVKRDKTSSREFNRRMQHEKVVRPKIGGNGNVSVLPRPRTHTHTHHIPTQGKSQTRAHAAHTYSVTLTRIG